MALAERHREVVAPWLVQVLEDVARDPSVALQDDYVLHDFAMVLLGHWRDTRAYRPLLALAGLPYETVDQLFGDVMLETYDRALASVCDGDLAPLIAIVEDDTTNVWVRMTLIESWVLRVIEGDAPVAPLEECLLAIGEREAARLRESARRDDDPPIIEAVAHAACDIGSERLRAPVLGWFDEKLIVRGCRPTVSMMSTPNGCIGWSRTGAATHRSRRWISQRTTGQPLARPSGHAAVLCGAAADRRLVFFILTRDHRRKR